MSDAYFLKERHKSSLQRAIHGCTTETITHGPCPTDDLFYYIFSCCLWVFVARSSLYASKSFHKNLHL